MIDTPNSHVIIINRNAAGVLDGTPGLQRHIYLEYGYSHLYASEQASQQELWAWRRFSQCKSGIAVGRWEKSFRSITVYRLCWYANLLYRHNTDGEGLLYINHHTKS